jgi:uncharacterized membrane protein
METIETSILVNVPLRTAYNQWTQFEAFPQFMAGVEEVRQQGDTFTHWRATIGGKTEEWDAEIVDQIPDQRISWRSTTGAYNAGTVSFQSLNATQTQVTLRLEYEPTGFFEQIGDALGFVERRVEGDLQRFKTFIEARGIPTGGWRGEIHGGQIERRGSVMVYPERAGLVASSLASPGQLEMIRQEIGAQAISTPVHSSTPTNPDLSKISITTLAPGTHRMRAIDCDINHDRYEIVLPGTITELYGLGLKEADGNLTLRDEIITSFGAGRIGNQFSADGGRGRTPILVLPKQGMILAYIQSFPKSIRITRTGTATHLVFRKDIREPTGRCDDFVLIKASAAGRETAIQQAYRKYHQLLRQRFFFKKPTYNAFGLGWETAFQYGCNTSLAKAQFAYTQFQAAGTPLSMLIIGSGYWVTTEPFSCGSGVDEGPPSSNLPTTDTLILNRNFQSRAALNQFIQDAWNQSRTNVMLGMRHNVSPANVENLLRQVNQANLAANRRLLTSPQELLYQGTRWRFWGTGPSNNKYFLNVLNRDALDGYIDAVRTAYGNFNGIKEDEMLVADQRTASGDPAALPFPDGTVKATYERWANKGGPAFIVMGANDYFGVGTDIQTAPGYVRGEPLVENGINILKHWVDLALVKVLSGYPHPAVETTGLLGIRRNTELVGNLSATESLILLRHYQALTFLPIAIQSVGHWTVTDPEIRHELDYYAKFRSRIQRYIFDHAMHWYNTGVPSAMTPLFFRYDEQGSYDLYTRHEPYKAMGEFLVGNALLVRPIYEDFRTGRSVEVYFPPGEWTNLINGKRYQGPGTHNVTISRLIDFPVFAKAGEIFLLNYFVQDHFPVRARLYPTANYQSTYTHYDQQGNPSGTITVALGNWSGQRNAIRIRSSDNSAITFQWGAWGDLQFNLLPNTSYTITTI